MSNAEPKRPEEFVVRVPQELNKTYNVMRFSAALNVDVKTWTRNSVRLERETSLRPDVKVADGEAEALEPRFGAGSEFGKAERDEARQKKYTPRKRLADGKQWVLKVGGKAGKRYRGIREGGFCENASYYIFFKAQDGAFEAVPVSEWYNFNLLAKYKALTAEEAEVAFEKRDKIRNFSLVMKSMKAETETGDQKAKKGSKRSSGGFRVTDMDDMDDESDGSGAADASGDEDKASRGKKKAGGTKRKGKKKGSDDEYDSDPGEESDEGDFDQREMDYISDSSSSDEEKPEDKETDLKGVADEDALRQLVISDDSDEEAEAAAEGDTSDKVKPDPDAGANGAGTKGQQESESSASDDSEDSDLDPDERYKAMFMQKKNNSKNSSPSTSRSQTPVRDSNQAADASDGVSGALSSSSKSAAANGSSSSSLSKRKLDEESGAGSPANVKKQKTSDGGDEGLSEEAIRRYLMRKPMTSKDLLVKFKSKVKKTAIPDLPIKIANLLKKIVPDQQTIKGELYFSLKPK